MTPSDDAERAALRELLLVELRARRSERRWRAIKRIGLLALLLGLLWLLWTERLADRGANQPHTAVIQIQGEIADDAEASADNLLPALRDALQDKNTRALILRINSPGGSPVQAGLVNDELRRLRALHDKPVYAVVEDTCASGAYYIAVAADAIYIDKASIVGSIGVVMGSFGLVDAMRKLGIERRLFIAGEHKGLADPFSPIAPGERDHLQALLDDVHQQFITVVQEGRGERLSDDPALFSGLFWTGEQALALGLADELGSVDSVARDVVGVERLVDYTQRPHAVERLARRLGATLSQGLQSAIQAVPQLY